MLNGLQKLNRQLATSLSNALDFHRKVRDALAGSDHPCVTDENIRKIDDVERFIVTARPVNALLESLVGDLRPDPGIDSTRTDTGAPSRSGAKQRRIALAEMAGAIAAKNAAWYLLPGIIPHNHVAFDDVGKMTALVAQRSVIALLVAAMTEYPLATDAQRRFKDAGGRINSLQAFAQSLDQVLALLVLFVTGKATGQEAPPAHQVAGFALTAVGAAFQAGALNGLIIRMMRPVFERQRAKSAQPLEETFVPIAIGMLRSNPEQADQGEIRRVERSAADPEQGISSVPASGAPDSSLNAWLDTVPARIVDSMRADLQHACVSVAKLHDAIFRHDDDPLPAGSAPAPAAVDHDTQVARFEHDLAAIGTAVRRFRGELSDDDARLQRIDAALAHAGEIERTLGDMRAGSTPKRTAFFASMALLSTIGSVLGAIGPSVHNAWLSDIRHRAAIFGVTSSVLQAFANLGQFLGGAKPGDGRLVRFLKIGLENDNNPYRAWAKNWLRAVRFLLGEFPLLQLSTTFSEMANGEAGQSPQAPAHGTPSAYTIRNVQEAFRAVFSLAFTALALGEQANWNHYLGLGITALGAIVPASIERATIRR
ncbi:hypothetical protein DIE21_19955 [Burkholderia sp. Bp9140]|uniref:hypothetical protein n=1 Tax=Burkholderia sp. Bp9140 TaxID=2184572 RepID=UPI000F567D8D|nr:hypothetical protein [Burkholderia sp. Bp9140]RQR49542.1 hypothetical protein DIE21_19955 [Burkholderia sp. Bp9140]